MLFYLAAIIIPVAFTMREVFTLPDKIYDILKFLVTIGLPAASSLYVGLAKVFGWPYASEVAQTTTLICTFIGTLIGISSHYYWQEPELEGDDLGDEDAHL